MCIRDRDNRAGKKELIGGPGGRRARGWPRRKSVDDVDENMRILGVRRWGRVAQDRKKWRHVILEARAVHEE